MSQPKKRSPLSVRGLLSVARHAFIIAANKSHTNGQPEMVSIFEHFIFECERHLVTLGAIPQVHFEEMTYAAVRASKYRSLSDKWFVWAANNRHSDITLKELSRGEISFLSGQFLGSIVHVLGRFMNYCSEVDRLKALHRKSRKTKSSSRKRKN